MNSRFFAVASRSASAAARCASRSARRSAFRSPTGLHELRVAADLANRHPRGPELREELDPLEVSLSVAAMAAVVAVHALEQPCPLGVAKGRRARSGGPGSFGDARRPAAFSVMAMPGQ